MDSGIIIESGHPLPEKQRSLGDYLADLPVATGAPTDRSAFIPDVVRGQVATSIRHWEKKLKTKYRTHQTNIGLRVWRIE